MRVQTYPLGTIKVRVQIYPICITLGTDSSWTVRVSAAEGVCCGMSTYKASTPEEEGLLPYSELESVGVSGEHPLRKDVLPLK